MSQPDHPIDQTRRRALKLFTASAGLLLTTNPLAFSGDGCSAHCPKFARDRFLKHMNCSKAIMESYAPALGIEPQQARALGNLFAGGMGRALTCGAVTAALMVLGLRYGSRQTSDSQADRRAEDMREAFYQGFIATHGSLDCSELLGVDITTDSGLAAAIELRMFVTRCPDFVETAASQLEQLI